jgi:ketosteroid isomerase-like protein
MRSTAGISIAVSILFLSGCKGSTPESAGTPTASSTSTGSFDEGASRAQIYANDSLRLRGVMTNHLDSTMMTYDPNVVHLGTGKVIVGPTALRNVFAGGIKEHVRDFSYLTRQLEFSDDHSMAWEYGTYTQTTDGPKGKPVKSDGTFLVIWKNIGGQWKIVTETSTSPD